VSLSDGFHQAAPPCRPRSRCRLSRVGG